jgi:hypothetical protein
MIASFLMAEYSHKGKGNRVSTGRLFSFMSGEFHVVSDGPFLQATQSMKLDGCHLRQVGHLLDGFGGEGRI